jgi:hypothetical protein
MLPTPPPLLPQVDWLTEKMRQNNFTVSAMHGDMPQVGTPPCALPDAFRLGRVLQAVAVACSALPLSPAPNPRPFFPQTPLPPFLLSSFFFLSSCPAERA